VSVEGIQRNRRRGLRLLLAVVVMLVASAWTLDRLFPMRLPSDNSLFARVVTDDQGRPLRAFPDDHGVWRYPIALDQVSPLYIQALLTYEDRAFWYHPGSIRWP